MVLVDSSIWIEAARRLGKLEVKVGLESLVEVGEATFCGTIKLEVLGGAFPAERERLEAFFDCLPYRSFDDAAWDFAKECAWKLRDAGFTIPWNDILIASLALTWKCRVYAMDNHYEKMRDVLGIRLYRPGYGGSYQPDTGR